MAERIVSPGVFTREIDQSQLPAAIQSIGAAIVGPTVKGPAFIPTTVRSYEEFTRIYGSYTDESYVPFVVADYFKNGGTAMTVTRILNSTGYSLTNGVLAVVAKTGSTSYVTHVLHPTQVVSGTGFESSSLQNLGSGSFTLTLSGSFTALGATDALGWDGSWTIGEGKGFTCSINPSSNQYVSKLFGSSPKSIDFPVYAQYDANLSFANYSQMTMSLAIIPTYDFSTTYQYATTPWITSQQIGTVTKDLFRFHTLSHGTSVSHEVKVGIRDIRTSTETGDPQGYGDFTVVVRRVNTTNIPNSPYKSADTDKQPEVVETFTNCNLNPLSSNYIVKKIGDRYRTITSAGDVVVNGDYENLSNFIRVEVTKAVTNRTNDKTLIPFGHAALYAPIPNVTASGSISAGWTAPSYYTSQVRSNTYSPNNYFGFAFDNTSARYNLAYLSPIPDSGSTTRGSAFYLGDRSQNKQAGYPSTTAPYTGSLGGALDSGSFTANVALDTRKFIVPFQGGFDGSAPNTPKFSGQYITAANTFGFDCTDIDAAGTTAYQTAFNLLANTDYYDMNMLLTPGIIDSLHPSVTEAARNLSEGRQDTFYVMDSNAQTDSIATAVNQVSTLDSNYTATYYPWVRIVNPSNNLPVWVPPSVVVPGVLAYNDSVAAPWYAPAGLTRGGLTNVTQTYINLSQAMRDTLYEARINPIASFPNEGVVVWGQKTLQGNKSALDRVNVRRLLITVKKYIASATRYLVFEQNVSATRQRFVSIVNPYLDQVKSNQGLYAFRVVMDESNNTPDLIDQNILYGQLFLQPTRTAEFIILDFNIQPTGAEFPQ
jgi:hypothetical protein